MTARIGMAVLALALAASPLGADQDPSDPQLIRIEGETFVASHNTGGFNIGVAFCGSASGYYVADGIDQPGEWIELALTLPANTIYTARLAVQGWPGEFNILQLEFLPAAGAGSRSSTEFRFTGIGVGCDVPYLWVAGELPLCASAGSYRARISLTSGTLARIDLLELSYENTPTAAHSWSRIKSLYP